MNKQTFVITLLLLLVILLQFLNLFNSSLIEEKERQERVRTLNEVWELVNKKTNFHQDMSFKNLMEEDYYEHFYKSQLSLEIQKEITLLLQKEIKDE